jgi:hypothetical protein
LSEITYSIERPSGIASYVFEFLFSTLGFRHKEVEAGSSPVDIFYGNDTTADCLIQIPVSENDFIWPDLLNGRVSERDLGRVISFDLVNAIGGFLTDEVNANASADAFDQHDRLIYEGSYQASSGYGDIPIVNRYVAHLSEVIERRLDAVPRPLWPQGKVCAIALSHDVDAPIKHGAAGGPWLDPRASMKRNILTNAYRAKWTAERLMGSSGLDHWHFPLIMDAESIRGFKSSFMFAVTRRFDRTGHPEFDVSYDVSSARFSELFRQLHYRDFEIGLHAGYLAFESSGRFLEEKVKLEKLAGLRVTGLRHHAWHTGRDVEATLEAHDEAGFDYDSSLAFNRQSKLRRSVALPYRPWSNRRSRALDVIQIPVALMDGHIFYHDVTPEDAIVQATSVVDMIRAAGGVGAIDWHVRTSSPDSKQFGDWGRTYADLLDYLAERDDIWVTNLGEINDWIRRREKLSHK